MEQLEKHVVHSQDPPLSARLEPFDSYWQGPKNVENGYRSFKQFYRSNYLKHFPEDREAQILIVSCGPGYLVDLLREQRYNNVLGIDSDPRKIEYALKRGLNCQVADAFSFLRDKETAYDLILCEQELNHLTKEEMVQWLHMCWRSLRPGATLIVYGLNGANPITGPDATAQNFDHFNTFTESSLTQVLELTRFEAIRPIPLQLYVFYKNPLNYVGLLVTGALHLTFRILFKIYGKSNSIFTKKLAAVCKRPTV